MPRRKLWIVVADGARARFFRADGADHTIRRFHEELYDPARRKGSELLADKPGRTQNRIHDQGRHAMEPDTDPKRVEKERFARHIAAFLEEAHKRDEFNELVLVAAPRTLGDLRSALSPQLAALVRHELHKDMTTLPDGEVEAQLRPLVWPHLA